MWPRALLTFVVVASSCCPGFFPLLPATDRVKSYTENTKAQREEGQKRLVAWMKEPAAKPTNMPTDPVAIRNAGCGIKPCAYHIGSESSAAGTVQARYVGFCLSPPAPADDGVWRLEFELDATLTDNQVQLDFRDVYFAWPMLGDNPSALTHGYKRGPRTAQDMADITKNCLDPLKAAMVKAIDGAP